MKLLVVAAFSASCLLSLPTATASSKATKAEASPNKIGEYVLGLVSCPGRCTSGANFGGILAADNVQQCNPEDKNQRWLIHQAQDDDGEPYTFQSRTNLGRCLGLTHNGGDMDFDAGDMAPANEATCTGGQLALVDCQDPTAKWLFTGAQLFSTACWIAGLSAAMTVNEDCTSLELSLAANGAPEPITRDQSFILLEPSFVETIVDVPLVDEEGSSSGGGYRCFANRDELKAAVDTYVLSGCNEGASVCPDITSNYGWPMNSWCVGKVTDMSELFTYDSRPLSRDNPMSTFNEDISLWDVSQVRDMQGMFSRASSFNGDLSSWDVSQVQRMEGMFYRATSFNQDLSSWNVGQVQDMNYMFAFASSFNGDISLWDVSQVQDMHWMFRDASSFNGNISLWNVSQVRDMHNMFNRAPSFNGDLSLWDVSRVQSMRGMFTRARSFNGDLSSWNVAQVQDMGSMFNGASSFNEDLSLWDVSRVQNTGGMFSGASSFNGDLSLWDVSQVQDMGGMFNRASSFNGNVSLWDVSQVQNMNGMFNSASSFNGDLSSWDVSQVQDIRYMFTRASSFNQNLCAWADKNFPYNNAANIFFESGCTYQSRPQIEQGGPFCASTCN